MSENEKKIIKNDYVTGSYFNIMDYMIRTTVRGMVNTAVPVVVTAVETTGTNSGAGYVSAKPLLMARDGYNNGLPNVDIPKLPYFRYQFGSSAIICDPKVGDVGLAVFAQADCSNINGETTEKIPPTHRQYDMSDGFYLGGFWGKKPTNYIELTDSEINIKTPDAININCPTVNITGDVIISGEMTAKGIVYSTHTHGGVKGGDSNTDVPNH